MPLRIDHPVDGGRFERSGPVLRHRLPRAPGQAAVGAPFELNGPLAVTLGVHAEDRVTIFQKYCGGVSEVLSFFPVHEDLALRVGCQIHQRDLAEDAEA